MTPSELKEARQAAGLSQQELADRLGVSRVTVSNWERGIHPIDKWKAAALEQEFGKVGSGE